MTDAEIVSIYSRPQEGGALQYFVGKQYGTGWLRTLGRIAFPILKRFGIVAAKTAQDVLYNDQKVLPSLKRNALEVAGKIIPGLSESNDKQTQEGIGITRRKININKKRRLQGTIFE